MWKRNKREGKRDNEPVMTENFPPMSNGKPQIAQKTWGRINVGNEGEPNILASPFYLQSKAIVSARKLVLNATTHRSWSSRME